MGFVSNIEKDDETGEGFRKTKDEFGKGIREPCHTQPTGSTVPDPLQSPDPEMTILIQNNIYAAPKDTGEPWSLRSRDLSLLLTLESHQSGDSTALQVRRRS